MDNKKFETLIDLIINEDEEKARALFHDIVVEKSREIYESIMEEEAIEEAKDDEEKVDEATEDEGDDKIEESFGDMDEMSLDEVGGLMDEVSADESGMAEEDEEFADIEVDDEDGLGDDEEGDHGEIKDELLNIEDKLDELMAEFEELMTKVDGGDAGDKEGEEGGEEEFGGEEMGDEDMMEAVQLQKVSVTHGDNGQNTKSIVSGGPKVSGNGAAPVKAFGGDEKGGKAQAPKDVKGAGQFKNAPGGKKADLEAAPKAKHGDDGQNAKSPVAESRKVTKRIVK